MQPLLTLNQAADLLGYSPGGLRKLLKAGRGPRFTRACGRGHYRFKPEWLEGFVEQGAAPPQEKSRPVIEARHGFDPKLLSL
jgi:excisionase family DNA binding protein